MIQSITETVTTTPVQERTSWPKWVMQTQRTAGLAFVIPLTGLGVWFAGAAVASARFSWVSGAFAAFVVFITFFICGFLSFLFWFAVQSRQNLNLTYRYGKVYAENTRRSSSKYANWKFIAFFPVWTMLSLVGAGPFKKS